MSSKVFDILFSPISLIVGDKIGHAITGVFLIAAGAITGNLALVSMGLGMVASSFTPKPKANKESANRLSLSFVTTEPRKMVFGTTALSTDVRYQTFTGTNQEFFHQVICCAAHQVSAISEIWIDNEKAWTVGGGVLGRFSGYLTVTTKLVGVSGAGFAVDAVWSTGASLTGCAQIWLKYKTTGASKSTDSPFSSGISPRLTIRGSGALVYDPRLDSTVTGGSGSQRSNDQTTWAFGSSGRNPALQLLWYLLGWQINGRISVGMGVPPARLDLPSFITAANVCDETVTLAAGGSESRYRSDGAFSEGDDRSVVISNLLASMAGTLRDNGGKIALTIFKNDLASPVAAFTEADILGEESWEQTAPLDKTFNVVRGHYVDASDNALYQAVDFPEVSLSGGSVDGIQRIDTVEYTNVQSAAQAQRLAKQRLQRTQYPGRYTAKFGPRAWQVSLGDPITLSHQGLGWSAKLFRVVGQSITPGGVTSLVLQEENAAIYAWAAEDSAPVVAGTPTVYDPQNSPLITGVLAAGTTADWPSVTDPSGTKPANNATKNRIFSGSTDPATIPANAVVNGDHWFDATVVPNIIKVRVGGAWQNAANLTTQGSDIGVANGATADLVPVSIGSQACTVVGNSYSRSAGNGDFNAMVRGEARLGPQFAEVDITPGAYFTEVILDDDATSTADANLLLRCGYKASTGYWDLTSNGTLIATGTTTANLTGKVRATYDGVRFRMDISGTQFGPDIAASSPTLVLWPKWLAYDGPNIVFTGLKAGAYTDNGLDSKDGKLSKVTNLPNVVVFNAGYKFTGTISGAASAGSPASCTISISAGNLLSGDTSIAVNASTANVTGTGGTTISYFLVADDPTNSGGALTITAVPATSSATVLSSNSRLLIGEIDVAFPTSGTSSGTGYGGGGGGYSGGGGGSGRPALP